MLTVYAALNPRGFPPCTAVLVQVPGERVGRAHAAKGDALAKSTPSRRIHVDRRAGRAYRLGGSAMLVSRCSLPPECVRGVSTTLENWSKFERVVSVNVATGTDVARLTGPQRVWLVPGPRGRGEGGC